MRTIFKLLTVLALAVSGIAASGSAALAAPPTNDTFPGATAVAIGFSQALDTTQATTDANDAQLNATCGAPMTDASVWYSLAGTDSGVIVDVSSSTYSAGVLVGIAALATCSLRVGALARQQTARDRWRDRRCRDRSG